MHPRDQLHSLIDELPNQELEAALRFLRYLRDTSEHEAPRQVSRAEAYTTSSEAPSPVQDMIKGLQEGRGLSDKEFLEKLGGQ